MTSTDEQFPVESFVQVGNLLDETLNLSKQEQEEQQKTNSETDNGAGILVVDKGGSIHSRPLSDISINTLDINAADEIDELEIRKKNQIIYCLLGICTAIVCCFYHTWISRNAREIALLTKVESMEKEINQLKFENAMMKPDNALFEIDNCYFNIRTSAGFGGCADDLTQSAYDWFDWSVTGLNSIFEGSSKDSAASTSEGSSGEPDVLSKIYSEWVVNIYNDALNWKWDDIVEMGNE